MRNPRTLDVWVAALNTAQHVYRVTGSFPRDERFGLVAQMRRCAVSVPSNIAEGCARESKRDFSYFLGVAAGSLNELETQTILAAELGLLAGDDDVHDSIAATKARLIRFRKLLEADLAGPRDDI